MLHPFMPFVTEEIYGMLPIKDSESIMISKYPEYNKEFIFNTEKDIVEEKIDFIRSFRNVKKENDIPKDAKVNINTNDNIIIKMLKLEDAITSDKLDIKSYEKNFYLMKTMLLKHLLI